MISSFLRRFWKKLEISVQVAKTTFSAGLTIAPVNVDRFPLTIALRGRVVFGHVAAQVSLAEL
jgi:hypothetical protein